MKIKNSLKAAYTRHKDNIIVRRRKRIVILNKKFPKFKVRQG